MTNEEIIKLAREAASEDGTTRPGKSIVLYAAKTSKFLERFAALVAASEREACAQACLVVGLGGAGAAGEVWAERCAPRTAQEIVDQTEGLAELFMNLFLQRVKEDSSTTLRNSEDVRAQFCWNVACQVQKMLTDTDPEDAVAELENETGGEK